MRTRLFALPHEARGSYVVVDESRAQSLAGPLGGRIGRQTVFLNRNDVTVQAGFENSSNNTSSIVTGVQTLIGFSGDDTAWQAVLDCVRNDWAAFDVDITDVDPGLAPHIECMIGATPQQAGFGGSVAGVAPFTCAPIARAIVFAFDFDGTASTDTLCWTISQEIAHAFGLDHEFECADVMTHLSAPCGDVKAFTDIDAFCGESGPRQCQCGGATQNSFQALLALLGPAEGKGEGEGEGEGE